MKVVINTNHNAIFSLSPKAIKSYLELSGKECYFYYLDGKERQFKEISLDQCIGYDLEFKYESNYEYYHTTWFVYTLNSIDLRKHMDEANKEISSCKDGSERIKAYDKYEEVKFSRSKLDRSDSKLIKVIEDLGEEANFNNSKLKIVEIPDGIEYYICGMNDYCSEIICEEHRTWC